MKNNSKGFTYIECIVSLSIMFIAVSLIYTSLYGSLNIINKNSDYSKTLNVAKQKLEEIKYFVANANEGLSDNSYYVEEDNYTVYAKLEKIRNQYECYKVDVKVVNKNTNIELSSYVTKQ